MNNLLLKFLLFASNGLMLAYMPAVQASESPHIVSKQYNPATCEVCHITVPKYNSETILISKNLPTDLTNFKPDGVAMCGACHDPDAYHKVGLEVDFPVPADLPLNQDNEIICLTCHYVHGRLDSDRPQASFSFLDRLLNDERLHKSFLLRRNNSNGELCLTCHNPSLGSK